jgi:hypothetical protein
MIADTSDPVMRMAAFEHVRRLNEIHNHLTAIELKPGFMFRGKRVSLINPQRGIFKPQQMSFLLSIKTVFPKRDGKVWYDDQRESTGRFSNFGKAGAYYYWISRGVDNREVRANRIRKSVGAENTFFADLTELEAMVAELQPLMDGIARTRAHGAGPRR